MGGSNNKVPEMVPITDLDMDRFHELAPLTLRRSNRAFFQDEFGRAFLWLLFGTIPVAGLIWLDWSAREWLLFLLVGTWTGIICDIFKLYFLHDQIRTTADATYENNFVWTIVDSLRDGKDVAPRSHLRAKYEPKMGVIVDLIFGGVGTFMVLGLFPEDLFAGISDNPTLRWTLIGYVAYRVMFTAWEIIEQSHPETENRTVRVAVGLRGAGVFVLGFLIAFFVGDEMTPAFSSDVIAWWVMLIVNSLCVIVSVLTMWGNAMIFSNTRWLRDYLKKRESKTR